MKLRAGLLLAFAFAALYVSVAASVLRYGIDGVLFPAVAYTGGSVKHETYRVAARSGNVMLVRRYGSPRVGCVVFFPGQHGGVSSYESLFPRYVAQGLAVFALAYPGQDGAPGRSVLREIPHLSQQALGVVGKSCSLNKTVFVGRSLGAMLAAYAAGAAHPAGLIIEGAAPSLSAAVVVRLRSRWYLYPLAALPISKLLSHDYSLIEGLSASPVFPVVVFQGVSDDQAPIEALRVGGALPLSSRLVAVGGGTHSITYRLAIEPFVQSAVRMLRQNEPDNSFRPKPPCGSTQFRRYAVSVCRVTIRGRDSCHAISFF